MQAELTSLLHVFRPGVWPSLIFDASFGYHMLLSLAWSSISTRSNAKGRAPMVDLIELISLCERMLRLAQSGHLAILPRRVGTASGLLGRFLDHGFPSFRREFLNEIRLGEGMVAYKINLHEWPGASGAQQNCAPLTATWALKKHYGTAVAREYAAQGHMKIAIETAKLRFEGSPGWLASEVCLRLVGLWWESLMLTIESDAEAAIKARHAAVEGDMVDEDKYRIIMKGLKRQRAALKEWSADPSLEERAFPRLSQAVGTPKVEGDKNPKLRWADKATISIDAVAEVFLDTCLGKTPLRPPMPRIASLTSTFVSTYGEVMDAFHDAGEHDLHRALLHGFKSAIEVRKIGLLPGSLGQGLTPSVHAWQRVVYEGRVQGERLQHTVHVQQEAEVAPQWGPGWNTDYDREARRHGVNQPPWRILDCPLDSLPFPFTCLPAEIKEGAGQLHAPTLQGTQDMLLEYLRSHIEDPWIQLLLFMGAIWTKLWPRGNLEKQVGNPPRSEREARQTVATFAWKDGRPRTERAQMHPPQRFVLFVLGGLFWRQYDSAIQKLAESSINGKKAWLARGGEPLELAPLGLGGVWHSSIPQHVLVSIPASITVSTSSKV
ncbi:hypothetical protein CALCODRAFT_483106 [Calocera cornea HHB12733]|uniref:Uncharacterized protein n=1 Tax=Calocera cornea HHB12733 TaxID=1353952 RepID=A0A165G3J3_9BASI|nr:hypothetical protein CALCODRAFT_483106 [Calocera cornea HHB12733]